MTISRPLSNPPGQSQDVQDLGLARALQHSESRRVQLLIGVLVCLMLLAILRHVTGGIAKQGAAFTARLIVLGAGAVYAAMTMLVVRRAEGRDKILPSFFWVGTAVVESAIPSLNIITLLLYARIEHVNALAAPAMIVYFLFTILSVLRLRPALNLLAAGLSAAQHAGTVIHTLTNGSSGYPSLFPFYLSYSVLIRRRA